MLGSFATGRSNARGTPAWREEMLETIHDHRLSRRRQFPNSLMSTGTRSGKGSTVLSSIYLLGLAVILFPPATSGLGGGPFAEDRGRN